MHINKGKKKLQTTRHPYYILNYSLWPFYTAMSLFVVVLFFVLWLHSGHVHFSWLSVGQRVIEDIQRFAPPKGGDVTTFLTNSNPIKDSSFLMPMYTLIYLFIHFGIVSLFSTAITFWLAPAEILLGCVDRFIINNLNHCNYFSCTILALVLFFLCLMSWWIELGKEAFVEGKHTQAVQYNILTGFVLFILSEIMIFFGFFWAFFHSSVSPAMEIGFIWPPAGIEPIYPWGMPLLNTLILVTSGLIATRSYQVFTQHGDYVASSKYLSIAIWLGNLFTLFQYLEYRTASYSMAGNIYGSVFYMCTGLHGLHVIVGTLFLIVCNYVLIANYYTKTGHVTLLCANWYWHFVDVVWLFLFICIYWWGGQ